jgi:hypothetical protein
MRVSGPARMATRSAFEVPCQQWKTGLRGSLSSQDSFASTCARLQRVVAHLRVPCQESRSSSRNGACIPQGNVLPLYLHRLRACDRMQASESASLCGAACDSLNCEHHDTEITGPVSILRGTMVAMPRRYRRDCAERWSTTRQSVRAVL